MDRLADDVRRELGRFDGGGSLGELLAVWPDSVGAAVAGNAWPARVSRDGTLHVATTSSAWAFELGQLAPVVLERLRELLGERAPTALRFAVGRVPEPAADAGRAASLDHPAPGPAERDAARSLTAAIADDDLRELVARAAAASLAASRSDTPFW